MLNIRVIGITAAILNQCTLPYLSAKKIPWTRNFFSCPKTVAWGKHGQDLQNIFAPTNPCLGSVELFGIIRLSQHWDESGHPQLLGILLDLRQWYLSVVRMSILDIKGRRFEPQHQYVFSLSKRLYPHCFSRLSCEMSTRWRQPREGCLVLWAFRRNST